MASGKVKWFNDTKGYGFIQKTQGEEIFVHYSSIQSPISGRDEERKTLKEGDAVEFDVYEGAKGLQAHNVTLKI